MSLFCVKATLMLPLEHASVDEEMTPRLMKDHIVPCDSSSRTNAPIVTLRSEAY